MPIARALSDARKALAEASPTPDLDAEVLLAHVLRTDRSALRVRSDEELSPALRKEFNALVKRRKGGEPVAYITGMKEFWSMPLTVTPDVLVPRPETEMLVEWGASVHPERILDLGTGSGCIALALAKELPDAQVVAVEQSGQAIPVALGNAQRLKIPNVRFQRATFDDFLSAPAKAPFDLIVSNPPYIPEDDPHLEELRHEPRTALESGQDGLRDLRTIVAKAPAHLARGGWLLVEHGAEQGSAVRRLFASAGFKLVETRQDLAGLDRVTGGKKT